MALDDLRIADSDMHVMEPADLWQRYIDPSWAHAAPVGMSEIERDMRVRVKNAVLLRLGRTSAREKGRPWRAEQDSAFVHAEERNWDAKSQVMAMDMEGSTRRFCSRAAGYSSCHCRAPSTSGQTGMEPEPAVGHRPGLQRLDVRLRLATASAPAGCSGRP